MAQDKVMGRKVVGLRKVVEDGEVRVVPELHRHPEDTKSANIDWKREMDAGHVSSVRQLDGALPAGPVGVWHVQGERQSRAQNLQRNRPLTIMNAVIERAKDTGRGRFPEGFDKRTNTYTPKAGRRTVMHGWPEFDQDGNVIG